MVNGATPPAKPFPLNSLTKPRKPFTFSSMANQDLDFELEKTIGENLQELTIPEILPLLPVRDVVIFSNMILPLIVSREGSIQAVEKALVQDRLVFLVAQKNQTQEDPGPEDLYTVGSVALILRMMKLNDGRLKILVQGISRAGTLEFLEQRPSFRVQIKTLPDLEVDPGAGGNRGPDAQCAGAKRKNPLPQGITLPGCHCHFEQCGGARPAGRPGGLQPASKNRRIPAAPGVGGPPGTAAKGLRTLRQGTGSFHGSGPHSIRGQGRNVQKPAGIFSARTNAGHSPGTGGVRRAPAGSDRVPGARSRNCICPKKPRPRP